MSARGLRNNNPGNIRRSHTEWMGESLEQTDPEYVQFMEPVYGLRAICKILMSYSARGVCTIPAIINTWAPPSENDTGAYVKDACKRTGFDEAKVLNLRNDDELRAIVKAIVWHENGENPYDDPTINAAMRLARAA